MSMLGKSQNIDSPVQQHKVFLANDVQWISGELKSLGNPHNYINQDNLDTLNVANAHFSPWSFTGLPNSQTAQAIVNKDNIHFFIFPSPTTLEEFRKPLRTSMIILNLPLAVIRGEAPFMSEAALDNFLDFWKGTFFPMCNASIHYLSECATPLPVQTEVLYINRNSILSYISG